MGGVEKEEPVQRPEVGACLSPGRTHRRIHGTGADGVRNIMSHKKIHIWSFR